MKKVIKNGALLAVWSTALFGAGAIFSYALAAPMGTSLDFKLSAVVPDKQFQFKTSGLNQRNELIFSYLRDNDKGGEFSIAMVSLDFIGTAGVNDLKATVLNNHIYHETKNVAIEVIVGTSYIKNGKGVFLTNSPQTIIDADSDLVSAKNSWDSLMLSFNLDMASAHSKQVISPGRYSGSTTIIFESDI